MFRNTPRKLAAASFLLTAMLLAPWSTTHAAPNGWFAAEVAAPSEVGWWAKVWNHFEGWLGFDVSTSPDFQAKDGDSGGGTSTTPPPDTTSNAGGGTDPDG
jgi:hypothetical protein